MVKSAKLTQPLERAGFDQLVKVPTCFGEEQFVVLPSPNSPSPFLPHDHKVPSVLIAIINSITGKTYKAPDATIFKKEEVNSDELKFDDRGGYSFEPNNI